MTDSTSNSESGTETRDYLALVRTDLANERTLLAYGRTALMVSATGVTLLEFFPESPAAGMISWPLVASGVLFAVFGLVRFLGLRSRLRAHPANAHSPK
jgi:putative membrane protein